MLLAVLVLAVSAGVLVGSGRSVSAATSPQPATGPGEKPPLGMSPQVSFSLGAPQQLFRDGQFGMTAMPDQQPAVLQQSDGSYDVFFNGRFSHGQGAGWVGMFSTSDFLTYRPVAGTSDQATPVFGSSCEGGAPSCAQNFDARYSGANAVFVASNGTDLLMIYNGTNTDFGGSPSTKAYYAEIGLARSTDGGLSWVSQGAIIQGTDPKPADDAASGAIGTPQPSAVEANGYIYVVYPYFPTAGYPDAGPPTIQVARSPTSSDGAPHTWVKYLNGSFDPSQDGLGGNGSQVVPSASDCRRPAQPSVAYSTYLDRYVMVLTCESGWFFTTSSDLVTWDPPSQFFPAAGQAPEQEFKDGQPTDENVTLVTLGDPSQTIGPTGYVLYSHRPAWGTDEGGELWLAGFSFGAGSPSAPRPSPTPVAPRHICNEGLGTCT